MGISASQTRLLGLNARKNNTGNESSQNNLNNKLPQFFDIEYKTGKLGKEKSNKYYNEKGQKSQY